MTSVMTSVDPTGRTTLPSGTTIAVVPRGGYRIADRTALLETEALGAGIAISFHDESTGIGALMHAILPNYANREEFDEASPIVFVDYAVKEILAALEERGVALDDIEVRIAGAGCPLEDGEPLDLGGRNLEAARRVLQESFLGIEGADVGGTRPRRMSLHVATGESFVISGQEETRL